MKREKLTVIDFFCGAGGFSEGFRQENFKIILGIDHWKPAMDTFNHNFNRNCHTKNILDFLDSIEEIEALPDSDVIIGSPPCVSFSNSNKSGKADKSLGIKLIKCFLRIVAVKRHKPKSKLKAWFMENVVNSQRHLKSAYTFRDLKLADWAQKNKINPTSIAIDLAQNSHIINSAEYGSIQVRNRVFSGEIVKYKKFVRPAPTNQLSGGTGGCLPPFKTLKILRDEFLSPYSKKSNKIVLDPIYGFEIRQSEITDHFYDTGIYKTDWQNSKDLKTDHPFMGRMSFPEDTDKPSRTVTATKIANSRESLIYKTEIKRNGNGQYRTPTIREAAIIMGFPLTYQFAGSENAKWRMVGNAVCPAVSRALAGLVKDAHKINRSRKPIVVVKPKLEGIHDLNTYRLKSFKNQPKKNIGSRFRKHPFKLGNMTIALTNYDIANKGKKVGRWQSTILYGTGKGYGIKKISDGHYKKIEMFIKDTFHDGHEFIGQINNGFSKKIAPKKILQQMYEEHKSVNGYLNPSLLVKEVSKIIKSYDPKNEVYEQKQPKIFKKNIVHKKQLYALYAINKIVTIANNK